MRIWICRLLRWLLWQLERREPISVAALALVREIASRGLATRSDQYKRAWVYTRLVRRFPEARRRTLSWALEAAVQRLEP